MSMTGLSDGSKSDGRGEWMHGQQPANDILLFA